MTRSSPVFLHSFRSPAANGRLSSRVWFMKWSVTGFAALMLPLALTGCTESDDDAFAPSCPQMHIPSEVADYYNYSAKGPSFDHLVTHASLNSLSGDCMATGHKNLRTRVGVHMVVRKGPAAPGETISLPWFIAVVHNDKIVGKHTFEQKVTFPAGQDAVAVDTRLVTVDLPIRPTTIDNGYRFEVGFQLNHTQVAYNREHGVTASFVSK
ncbi:MAG: hypothetical protein ABF876_00715 [Acetobacter aceti]|uniref:Uncharacterized protein n=1 Tax=Acetobacter aceti TaxID=435 RepID=A0A1U9KHJ0_ACEAC|nr:hypothetical protein [Acetobacter aceti]AQS85282.1 hypothetical protein A0U92_11345 [Acetobacter aceti]